MQQTRFVFDEYHNTRHLVFSRYCVHIFKKFYIPWKCFIICKVISYSHWKISQSNRSPTQQKSTNSIHHWVLNIELDFYLLSHYTLQNQVSSKHAFLRVNNFSCILKILEKNYISFCLSTWVAEESVISEIASLLMLNPETIFL